MPSSGSGKTATSRIDLWNRKSGSAGVSPVNAGARVVVNEIFFHAPDDLEDLEFIELYNTGGGPIDLGGWRIGKGIKFTFAPGTTIEPKGFLVLCPNRARFKEFYDVPVAGVFDQTLSNKGERLELADAQGKIIDAVKYRDSAPWPMGADGFSGLLERISPDDGGEDSANWASSPLSGDRVKPAGTPGRVNADFIRFRIQAVGKNGGRRFFPAETEPRPALSSYVHGPIEPGNISFGWIINTTEAEFKAAELQQIDPDRALQSLDQTLQSLREHVKKRREFLLAQDEIKSAGPVSRADSKP